MSYLYGNDWRQAQNRLQGLENVEDEHTFRLLDRLGVRPGWRCLEIGAGAGSVAAWLCEHVGPEGRVVATDIDTRLLENLPFPQLEVRRHNLVEDPIEPNAFDLIHARHVLIHVPAKQLSACLGKLVNGLKDGGRILVEESDFKTNCAETSMEEPWRAPYDRVMARIHRLYEQRGMDLNLGMNLFARLQAAGIAHPQSEARMRFVWGGSAESQFHKTTFSQLRPKLMVNADKELEREYDAFLALHDNPRFVYRTRMTVSTLGIKRGGVRP